MFSIHFLFMKPFNHVNAGKSTSNMLLTEEQSDNPKYKRGRKYKKKVQKMQNVEVKIFKITRQAVTSHCAAQAVTCSTADSMLTES